MIPNYGKLHSLVSQILVDQAGRDLSCGLEPTYEV